MPRGLEFFLKTYFPTGNWRQKIYLPTQKFYFPNKSWKKNLKKIQYLAVLLHVPNMTLMKIVHFCQGSSFASSCSDKAD